MRSLLGFPCNPSINITLFMLLSLDSMRNSSIEAFPLFILVALSEKANSFANVFIRGEARLDVVIAVLVEFLLCSLLFLSLTFFLLV